MCSDNGGLDSYKRQLRSGGPEYILETAAWDRLVSDEEYDKLVDLVKKETPAKSKRTVEKLRDRDEAKEVLKKDFL